MHGEKVHIVKGQIPSEYHCQCKFCQKALGELLKPDGTYYSRLERRKYYDPAESGKKEGAHIAKTPLHIARWAIQNYSKPGDWVLDPTIGAGTTAVEAITQGRNVAGMEIEFGEVLKKNIQAALVLANGSKPKAKIGHGDARNISAFLDKAKVEKVQLVVNNPPYSGDASMPSPSKEGRGAAYRDKETYFFYDKSLPNLAFLKEGQEYWDEMTKIYKACADRLEVGGHFVIGIKDMSKKKQPYLLHKMFCEILEEMKLKFVGTAFLNHYPATLHLNTCFKFYGFHPPKFQTINVFKKTK
jgi:tRNA G10  N-methylase Trm11